MHFLSRWLLAATLLSLLGACATPPAVETHAGPAIFADKSTVGLLLELPETPAVWAYDPERGGVSNSATGGTNATAGAIGGLLQGLVVGGMVGKLNAHARTLPLAELRALEADLRQELARKGLGVRPVLRGELKDFKPARFDAKDGSTPGLDYRPLRERLGVDRLLAVKLQHVGFNYPFAGVIALAAGDPMAHVLGEAYLLDLRSNSYLWYRKVRVLRGVGKAWDEPPGYPGLTAKYFEVLEAAKDDIVGDLLK